MDEPQIISKLLNWFEYQRFQIRDLTDEMVQELTPLMLGEGETDMGQRTVIGKRLAHLDGYRFETANGTTAVFVASFGPSGRRLGTYQIRQTKPV